jgi:hypothetical protein
MSVIDGIIQSQAFQVLLIRIGEILAEEVAHQYELLPDEDINAPVFLERFIPFDKTELPVINVSLSQGDLGNQIAFQSNGTYRFAIDCHTSAQNTEENNADSAAMMKLQRLLGLCRAILEDPRYKTLGYPMPFISRRLVESISIAPPNAQDAAGTVMGRLSLVVMAPETTSLIVPPLLAGYKTDMKLELTDKGYIFTS